MGNLLQAMVMGALWGLVWAAVTNYPPLWAARVREKRGQEAAGATLRTLFSSPKVRWGLCAAGGILGFIIGMQPEGSAEPSPIKAVILAGVAVVVAEWYSRRVWLPRQVPK